MLSSTSFSGFIDVSFPKPSCCLEELQSSTTCECCVSKSLLFVMPSFCVTSSISTLVTSLLSVTPSELARLMITSSPFLSCPSTWCAFSISASPFGVPSSLFISLIFSAFKIEAPCFDRKLSFSSFPPLASASSKAIPFFW